MAKQTFEEYVRTELVSGLQKIKLSDDIKKLDKDEMLTVFIRDLANDILNDFNPSDDDAFAFFADFKHRECVQAAVDEYEPFDGLVNEGLFVEGTASEILKSAVRNTIMYNISKTFKNIDVDDEIIIDTVGITKLNTMASKKLKIIKSF